MSDVIAYGIGIGLAILIARPLWRFLDRIDEWLGVRKRGD
jgi:hypothetical protein